MNIELFDQYVWEIRGRLAELYQSANASEQPKSDLLLPSAFKELGTASEELQVAAEELLQQNQELVVTRSHIEAERERYRDLFELFPDACLLTDAQGKIQDANRAAAILLHVEASNLVGKLLVNFIPLQERQAFRCQLNQRHQYEGQQEWTINMQRSPGEVFEAAVNVDPILNIEGNLDTLRWIIRDITERKQADKVLTADESNLYQNRPKRCYSRGEIISLEPQTIWLVCQGLVKLNTMSERGDEALIGLVGQSMAFGSSMTGLPTYQATALSQKVELVGISLSELAASPLLAQILLPKISERLRQTELLLAISGKRHVKDRLYYLLQWLKQEFGCSIAEGTRLSIRLTHQDLADACCTTRVTVTRLLGQLHKQGKIAFDSKNHICLIDRQYRKCS